MCRSSRCFAESLSGGAGRVAARLALALTVAWSVLAVGIAAPPARAQGSTAVPPPARGAAVPPRVEGGTSPSPAARGGHATLGGRLDRAADAAAAAVADAPAAAGDLGEVYGGGVGLLGYSIKVIALLGGLCALGFLAVKVLGPRLGPRGGSEGDPIRVRAVKRLDAKTTLYLVDVEGRSALVGVSDREVRALTRLELPPNAGVEEDGGEACAEAPAAADGPARLDSGDSRFEALLGKKALRRGRTEGKTG